jgi:hypothetical protein
VSEGEQADLQGEETQRLRARIERLEQTLVAKDALLVAYRLGDPVRADKALAKLEALAAADEEDGAA